MKKSIALILLCIALMMPCGVSAKKVVSQSSDRESKAAVVGVGDAEKTYNVGAFQSVSVSTGVSVVYTVGRENRVKVVATSSKLLNLVEVKSVNGKLSIGIKPNSGRIKGKVTAYVSGQSPSRVSVSSGADFKSKSRFDLTGGSFEASASSGGSIDIPYVKAVGLTLKSSSSSDIDINGCNTGTVSLTASSGSDIEINSCNTSTVSLTASSGSDIEIKSLNGSEVTASTSSGADIKISKASVSGTTTYKGSSGSSFKISGSGRHVNFTVSSGADVNAEDFSARTGVVSASTSGGNIKCNVQDLEVAHGKIKNKKR